MFNFQAPYIKDEALLSFAAKHDIKKIVTSDGTVKWYGCKRGLSYTKDKKCDWPDGIGAPPCDLWNLGEAVKFIMQACDEGGMACEYAAGNVLGKINILYWLIYTGSGMPKVIQGKGCSLLPLHPLCAPVVHP